jgi:hypothetical protein
MLGAVTKYSGPERLEIEPNHKGTRFKSKDKTTEFLVNYHEKKKKPFLWSEKDVEKTDIALHAAMELTGLSHTAILERMKTYMEKRNARGIHNHHKPYNFLCRLACGALEDVPVPWHDNGITIEDAWECLLGDEFVELLPRGVVPFLRAGQLHVVEDGWAQLCVPDGPGLERIKQLRAEINQLVSETMGNPWAIEVLPLLEGN